MNIAKNYPQFQRDSSHPTCQNFPNLSYMEEIQVWVVGVVGGQVTNGRQTDGEG